MEPHESRTGHLKYTLSRVPNVTAQPNVIVERSAPRYLMLKLKFSLADPAACESVGTLATFRFWRSDCVSNHCGVPDLVVADRSEQRGSALIRPTPGTERKFPIAQAGQVWQDSGPSKAMHFKLLLSSALRTILAVSALVLACSAPLIAQDSKTLGDDRAEKSPLEPIEEEFRIKRFIKLAQKQHQENINRAQELSSLGAQIGAAFKEKNQLDREDFKKIDKLEKLAKSIRSAAGGSDDANEANNAPNLSVAVSEMTKLTSSLKEEVEKTPRRVVSAAVIDHANVLLELIRRIRDLSSKA